MPNLRNLKKEKLPVLGDIGSRHHQTSGDERKNYKRVPQTNCSKPNPTVEICQSNKHLGGLSSKILRIVLKINEEGTQTNGLKKKKIDDDAQGLIFERWLRQTICVKKRQRQRIPLYWRERDCIDMRTT